MNAWLPQASYPCGNFSDTSSFKFRNAKGSIGHAFTVCIHTENQNQVSFYPFVLHEISVLIELTLGHLRYRFTDVPPQPNSPPDNVLNSGHRTPPLKGAKKRLNARRRNLSVPFPPHSISKKTIRVVVFQVRAQHKVAHSHLCYTSNVFSQSRTRVKLNRVFFPR